VKYNKGTSTDILEILWTFFYIRHFILRDVKKYFLM